MITVFNRRELITIASMQKFFNIKEALASAGIASQSKTVGSGTGWSSRSRGVPGLPQELFDTYTIYVHRDDYDQAIEAIRPALRDI